TTLTASMRHSAGAEPSGTAVRCSNASAVAKPAEAGMVFAITAAAAGPPTRGCRMRPMLDSATGNIAKLPESTGPALPLNPMTAATRVQTSSPRRGTWYQWCFADGAGQWPNRSASGTHTRNVTTLSAMAPPNVQVIDPATSASANQAAKAAERLAAI